MRWIGFAQAETTPPNDALISSAARDLVLLGKDREAVELIKEELGLVEIDKTMPTTMVGIQSGDDIPQWERADLYTRPQRPWFRPTHFLIDARCASAFRIDDIRVGNKSCFLNGMPIPGDAFKCRLRGDLELGSETINVTDRHDVDLAPFAIDCNVVEPETDLTVCVTNIYSEAMMFRGWFLGRMETDPGAITALQMQRIVRRMQAAADEVVDAGNDPE